MRDQRRFIVTRWEKDAKSDKLIPLAGHLIGAGTRSVITMSKNVTLDFVRQLTRETDGRFSWWPNRKKDRTPDTVANTRQRRRAEQRTADKLFAFRMKDDMRRAKRQGTPADAALQAG